MFDPVLPPFLTLSAIGEAQTTPLRGGTTQLLVGEVKEAYSPTHKNNISKLYTEYKVTVQHRGSRAMAASVDFPNCLVASQFGGASDKSRFALRADETQPERGKTFAKGARVLILCVAGDSSQAYIVGAIRNDKETDPEGLFYEFEYNGVTFGIGNEGQVKFSFVGATQTDGKPVNEDLGETKVEIKENGTLIIATPEQTLTLDKDSNEIRLESGDKLTVHKSGVKLGNGGESMVKGSTYRQQEQALHQTLLAQLTVMSTLTATAAAAFTTASGMLVIPVVGAISAAAPIAVAATSMASIVQAIAQMTSAIAQFEAQSATYLSSKHDLD